MDEMPSSEFRRRYATLTEPTRVTVLGHLIGTWTPYVLDAAWQQRIVQKVLENTGGTFNSRPFTPVPKTKGK